MIQQAIHDLKNEVREFYANKLQQTHARMGELELNLKSLNNFYGLPVSVTQNASQIQNIEPATNILIPSPISIGTLKPIKGESKADMPAYFDFISSNGICVDIDESNTDEAYQWLQNIALKIIVSLRPDLVDIVIIDVEGGSRNFRTLCGYDRAKANIAVNRQELNAKLVQLDARFTKMQRENLIRYDNLETFNCKEGTMAKPYTFIFISNYPSEFSQESVTILKKIVTHGKEWGAFVFMTYDIRNKLEFGRGELISELLSKMARFQKSGDGYRLVQAREAETYNASYVVVPDSDRQGNGNEVIATLNQFGKKAGRESITQESYFNQILNREVPVWQEYAENDSRNIGIRVPIGKKNAVEDAEFVIGMEDKRNYHGIIGGKTGTGKTVLLNNIIINGALRYSPAELQFVLLDFKGVSFKNFKDLPHTRALFSGIKISEGLNIMRFVMAEYKRRNDIFDDLSKDDINSLTRQERIDKLFPRMLIVIDEFQEILKNNDEIGKEANKIIDEITRKGRAYGLHLLLSSQDLEGISLSETAQRQCNLRIALNIDERSCRKIFSTENTAASQLGERPKGTAVLNQTSTYPSHANETFRGFNLDNELLEKMVAFLANEYGKSDLPKTDRLLLSTEKKAALQAVTQEGYFNRILAGEVPIWQENREDTSRNIGIRVPIGINNESKNTDFIIGMEDKKNYHGIIGGKTGTGKTVLLNNIIINGALRYSPAELQFVLLDFKGVSFKNFKDLPHARAIFSGIEIAYGLNVMRFVMAEYKRRNEIFDDLLKDDINALTRQERLTHLFPRMLIIMDEFQEILKNTDEISKEASSIIDEITRKGRSYGLHLLLSSQDLEGISLSDTAQRQCNLRIALNIDEKSCRKIFSGENAAASGLGEKPKGTAILNQTSTYPVAANEEFRVFNLDPEQLEKMVAYLASEYPKSDLPKSDRFFLPNDKSSVVTGNAEMVDVLFGKAKIQRNPKIYLGEPTFIKTREGNKRDDSYVRFKSEENSNLLIAGKDINGACTLIGLTALQLIIQKRAGTKVYLLNNFGAGKSTIRERFRALENLDSAFKYFSNQQADEFFKMAQDEIDLRKTDESAQDVRSFFIVLNIDTSFRKDGRNVPDRTSRLSTLLKQGPPLGINTTVYSFLASSVNEADIDTSCFENKIVLKGEGSGIIGRNEKEPRKDRQAYLHAPTPVTSINPDLFNIYSRLDETKLQGVDTRLVQLLKEMISEFVTDDE